MSRMVEYTRSLVWDSMEHRQDSTTKGKTARAMGEYGGNRKVPISVFQVEVAPNQPVDLSCGGPIIAQNSKEKQTVGRENTLPNSARDSDVYRQNAVWYLARTRASLCGFRVERAVNDCTRLVCLCT